MSPNQAQFLRGFGFALAAGFFWGGMGVAAQVVLHKGYLNAMELVTVRLLTAGLILLLCNPAAAIRTAGSGANVRDLIISGFFILLGQYAFMESISYGNAATAAIMLTTVPLWVAIWQIATGKAPISPREIICFVLACAGVSLIVTKGDFTQLSLDPLALAWAFVSAVASAVYTVQPRKLLTRAPVTAVMGWSMIAGGIMSSFITPPWSVAMPVTVETVSLMLIVVVIGTVCAFACYMMAVRLISPVAVGLLICSEPLSAYFLSITLLGMVTTSAEWLGVVFVIANVVVLALGNRK